MGEAINSNIASEAGLDPLRTAQGEINSAFGYPKMMRARAEGTNSRLAVARLLKSRLLPGAAIATVVLTAPGLSLGVGQSESLLMPQRGDHEGRISTNIPPFERPSSATTPLLDVAAPSSLLDANRVPAFGSVKGRAEIQAEVVFHDAETHYPAIDKTAPELLSSSFEHQSADAVSDEQHLDGGADAAIAPQSPATLVTSTALRGLELSAPGGGLELAIFQADLVENKVARTGNVRSLPPVAFAPVQAISIPEIEFAPVPVVIGPVEQSGTQVSAFAIRSEEKATVSDLALPLEPALETPSGEDMTVRVSATTPKQVDTGIVIQSESAIAIVEDLTTDLVETEDAKASVATGSMMRASEPVASLPVQVAARTPAKIGRRSAADPIKVVAPTNPVVTPDAAPIESAFVPGLKGREMSAIPGLGGNAFSAFEVKSRLVTRIDGRVAGEIDFQQTGTSLKVRIGSIVELLKDRFEIAELNRIASSAASDVYLTIAQLQDVGIPISYDPVYDEFNIGSNDYRPSAAHKVQIDQISSGAQLRSNRN